MELSSVRDFISSAESIYPERLKNGRGKAFEVYMKSKGLYYMYSVGDFMPYFKEFIRNTDLSK